MGAKPQPVDAGLLELDGRREAREPAAEPLVALSKSAFERLLARSEAPVAQAEPRAPPLQLVDIDQHLELISEPDASESVQFAKALYRFRRRREQEFGDDLFGDPVWDMLLDLYVAELTGRRVSVSSSCIASAVPISTALRRLRRLEERDIVRRDQDLGDRRRIYLRPSEEAVRKMTSLLHLGRGMIGLPHWGGAPTGRRTMTGAASWS